jgi:ABC-type Na+ efflux pump permease subunit
MARRYAVLVFLTFAMALLFSMMSESKAANAPTAPASGASGPPPGPPPEAVAACQGKTAGTQVTFSGRNGESFTGVCQLINGVLAARPAGNGGPPPRR